MRIRRVANGPGRIELVWDESAKTHSKQLKTIINVSISEQWQ